MKTLIALLFFVVSLHAADDPETVIVTVKAKAGQEARLESVMKKHWATIKRLDLVTGDAHMLLKSEGGTFVDVFTWKSHAIPDNAPAEVLAIWKEMNEASTKLDILEVKRVD